MNMLVKIALILIIQVLPSSYSEDMPSIQLNVLFQQICPDFIQYTENIRQIEKDTQTDIQLIQIVRISGDLDKIKQAHQRVSQLNANLTQEKSQVSKTTKIEDLLKEIQESKNIFERKFQELKNTMDNKMDIQAKLSENMVKLSQDEKQDIKSIKNEVQVLQSEIQRNRNVSEIQFQNMVNLVQEEKQEIKSIKNEVQVLQSEIQGIKNKSEVQFQNMTNAMANIKLEKEATNTKVAENEDVISDEELEKFYIKYGRTLPLHVASELGKLDVVKKLIKNGMDVNIKDYSNRTPLMYAILDNHKDTIEFLISKNANVNIRTKQNYTALTLARNMNRYEIIKILETHGATE